MKPLHVGVIMDGNGRWAEARGLPRAAGHRQGAEALRRIGATEFALVGAVSPVSVAVMSALGLGEPFGPRQMAGAALVIAGVLLVSLKKG